MPQGVLTYTFIVVALNPRDETQQRQDLRLNTQRNVELLDDVVHAQRHAGPCPKHHHRGLKASCIMAAIVDNDLGDELYHSEYHRTA